MKRFIKMVLVLGILGVFLGITGNKDVHAEIKYYDANLQNYKYYDLDGDGTKETIRVDAIANTDIKEMFSKIILYVNNEKVFETKLENAWGIDYGFVDINPKDKSKQLIVRAAGEDADHTSYVFKYRKGKCTLLFSTEYDIQKSQSKNNKVRCVSNFSCRIGLPHIVFNCKIKNKKLVPVKNSIVNIANDSFGTQHLYEVSKKIKVYKGKTKVNTNKVVRTLVPGEKFRIIQVMGKFTKKGAFNAKYCLIENEDGKTLGWINVTGEPWNKGQIVANGLFYG